MSLAFQGLTRSTHVCLHPTGMFIVSATLLGKRREAATTAREGKLTPRRSRPGALFFREFDSYNAKAVVMFTLGVSVTVGGIALISCSGSDAKVRGEEAWQGEMEQFGNVQMGARNRGPSDPLEPNYFDADLSWDEKHFADAPALQRLVLI